MKKAVVILLAFMLSFSLFACDSGVNSEIISEVTQKIAETVSATISNSAYDVEICLINHPDVSEKLSQVDAEKVAGIIKNGKKKTEEVNPDCLTEYKITVNGEIYTYHADCGTLQNKQADEFIIIELTEDEKEKLNGIFKKYGLIKSIISEPDTSSPEIVSDSVEDLPYVNDVCLDVSGTPLYSRTAAADFGFRLFKEALNEETNALVSPASVITALTMAANGANGETLKEIEKMLGMDIKTLNNAFAKDKSVSEGVKSANSVWIRKNVGLNVNQNFIDINKKNFGAEVFTEKFDGTTLKKINGWVSDNTDGLIENMLNEIPADAVMYLINTILFDAEWEFKYSAADVRENQTFTSESGKKQTVSMLFNEDVTSDYNNFRLGKNEVVIKDYTNGYSFAAMLPDKGVSVSDAVSSFSGSDFVNAVTKRVDSKPMYGIHFLKTHIPKFEFECSFDFTDILKKLGMPTAFDSQKADFGNMATSPAGNIFIGRVGHNTHIMLNENGTKAGAATYVEMKAGSAAVPPSYRELRFDRPFIYVIYETNTGMPLFVGTVREF
ncbi:MAG: serpin family protein [Clostridia bacterium]|nr:serpin family protein [Clostridia bacterium]